MLNGRTTKEGLKPEPTPRRHTEVFGVRFRHPGDLLQSIFGYSRKPGIDTCVVPCFSVVHILGSYIKTLERTI